MKIYFHPTFLFIFWSYNFIDDKVFSLPCVYQDIVKIHTDHSYKEDDDR